MCHLTFLGGDAKEAEFDFDCLFSNSDPVFFVLCLVSKHSRYHLHNPSHLHPTYQSLTVSHLTSLKNFQPYFSLSSPISIFSSVHTCGAFANQQLSVRLPGGATHYSPPPLAWPEAVPRGPSFGGTRGYLL